MLVKVIGNYMSHNGNAFPRGMPKKLHKVVQVFKYLCVCALTFLKHVETVYAM